MLVRINKLNLLQFINTSYFSNYMVNKSNKVLDTNITKLVNQTYQYGFSTNIEKDIIDKGLNEETIKLISKKKRKLNFY